MKNIDAIFDFINYSPQKHSQADAYTEFTHKYQDTILKIDGEYYSNIGLTDGFVIYGYEFDSGLKKVFTKVKTIERFTPKTGFYKSANLLIYLYRLPLKQYKKSFYFQGNYDCFYLEAKGEITNSDVFKMITDVETDFQEELIWFENKLYFYGKHIGNLIDQHTVELFNDYFYHEVTELCPQLKVTMRVNVQRKPMDEKLLLDF